MGNMQPAKIDLAAAHDEGFGHIIESVDVLSADMSEYTEYDGPDQIPEQPGPKRPVPRATGAVKQSPAD